MNTKTYDAGLLFGTLMLFGGSVARWDWPTGFLVAGSIVIVLTLFGTLLSLKR